LARQINRRDSTALFPLQVFDFRGREIRDDANQRTSGDR